MAQLIKQIPIPLSDECTEDEATYVGNVVISLDPDPTTWVLGLQSGTQVNKGRGKFEVSCEARNNLTFNCGMVLHGLKQEKSLMIEEIKTKIGQNPIP